MLKIKCSKITSRYSNKVMAFIFILILITISSGCVSNPFGKPVVKIASIDSQDSNYDLSKPGRVEYYVTVKVYNEGDALAKNVKANIEAIDESGKVLGTSMIFIGNVDQGESKSGSIRMWVTGSVKKFRAKLNDYEGSGF